MVTFATESLRDIPANVELIGNEPQRTRENSMNREIMSRSRQRIHIVYLSFDRFPSPKGAATHIEAFTSALGQSFGNVDLLTVLSESEEYASGLKSRRHSPLVTDSAEDPMKNAIRFSEGVLHHPMAAFGENLFERVINFRANTQHWWQQRLKQQADTQRIVHFRSIFEGYPIAREKARFCDKLVFEVNGLPSIELKYRYPDVADDSELLGKLHRQEQVCLEAADLILTVSHVNAAHLVRRGVPEDRIRIIPNGVDPDVFTYTPLHLRTVRHGDTNHEMRMLYSGTMSAWQGVSIAIDALALFRRDLPATLTLVGPASPRQLRDLRQQARKLGVEDFVQFMAPVSRSRLSMLHSEADVIVAPLTGNDRNLVQGCCPLKVLEAMASGTPLIASDLPVVRELARDGVEALLVRPGSAKAIKDGMLRLHQEPDLANCLSRTAREHVTRSFTWARAQASLIDAYDALIC